MNSPRLNVALIAGPMYDGLYQTLPEFTRLTGIHVEIGFHGVHPELNAHLAALPQVKYDLVSTHTKYAPSQRHFLGTVDEGDWGDFFPSLLEMSRIDGELYGLPRNLDAKLLHYRTDLVAAVPQTWDELRDCARVLTSERMYGFSFTGKDSGLFGMFFELAEMGGATLFPEDHIPKLSNGGGRWALQMLRDLYQSGSVPPAVKDWQYDEAHISFRDGCAAMICDWPGYYSSYCALDSRVRDRFGVARMPAGPLGKHKAYSGSHTFALTKCGMNRPEAKELLRFLTLPAQQLKEAETGAVPVRRSVMEQVKGNDTVRWAVLQQVIASDTLIPPRIAYYPEIEEILWRTVRSAMTSEIEVEAALAEMETEIVACHVRHTPDGRNHVS